MNSQNSVGVYRSLSEHFDDFMNLDDTSEEYNNYKHGYKEVEHKATISRSFVHGKGSYMVFPNSLSKIDNIDEDPFKIEDYKNIKQYSIEYPSYLEDFANVLSPLNIYIFILQVSKRNQSITPFYHKPEVKYYENIKYDEIYLDNVKVFSVSNPGYYRKLIYIDYEYSCSEFYNYPIFKLSDDVYKVEYEPLSLGIPSAVQIDTYCVRRDFQEDFYYIGDKRFALITREETFTRDHHIANKKSKWDHFSSSRYKRKFSCAF